MNSLKTIRDFNFKGKRVLVRVDFNVPLDKKTGKVTDCTRIIESLPTIKYLLKQGARVIVISHLGRPEGKVVPGLKLDCVSKELTKLIKKPVKKIDSCHGKEAEKAVGIMKNEEILILENVRFCEGEECNSDTFSKQLAKLGDVFVSDAFGAVHRAHASTAGLAKYLPAYAGLLLAKEVEVLSKLISNPEKPLTLIMGGAKMATKIGVLKGFMKTADNFMIGGALANTFLAAAGYDIGDSLYEKGKVETAQDIMLLAEKRKKHFILPRDVIVASEIGEKAETLTVPVQDVEGDMKILDIGPMTLARYTQVIQKSKTIIWNGPMGLFEYKPFANGTKVLAKEIARSQATTILGGGDTIEALQRFKIRFNKFSHVSTGGGAMLEYLEGKELPGLKALEIK